MNHSFSWDWFMLMIDDGCWLLEKGDIFFCGKRPWEDNMIHARCDKGISRLQIVVWYAGKSKWIFGIEGQKPLIFMQNSTQKNTKHKPLGLKMSPFEDDLERERKETAKRTLELMEARFRKIRCKQPWRAGFLKRRREEWLKWPWRVRMPKSTLSCQSPYVLQWHKWQLLGRVHRSWLHLKIWEYVSIERADRNKDLILWAPRKNRKRNIVNKRCNVHLVRRHDADRSCFSLNVCRRNLLLHVPWSVGSRSLLY